MKHNSGVRKRRVSGFTLLEMVIVMGIITILLGVLIPTMRTYMKKSRLNTANSNSKVIFNALQTVMQEYEFSERAQKSSLFYGTSKSGYVYLYCVNGTIKTMEFTASDGSTLGASDHELPVDPKSTSDPPTRLTLAAAMGSDYTTAGPKTLGARMGRLFTDYQSVAWYAVMKDYSVVGVLSASAENSPYIGGYPLSIQERKIDVADLFNPGTKISASNMSTVTKDTLAKYARTAWNDKDIVP